MALIDSLLSAIITPDGDALVMHVGERPYIVSTSGLIELSPRPLTFDGLAGILEQVLPADSRRALEEVGAVEYDLPDSPAALGERFTMVAARGGSDIWVEVRRHRQPVPGAEWLSTGGQPDRPAAAADARRSPELVETPRSALPASPPDSSPANVLPLMRNSVRADHTPRPPTPARIAGLDRLLRLAAALGATTLYVTAQGVPAVRVDGEIGALDGEPALEASEVESMMLVMAPERNRQALRSGEGTEWLCDVPEVGRVRCMSFRDHRGPGGIFRLISTRAVTADQLGLSREILNLCSEPGGLVLVAGPRSSGKSTLVSALVDHINRTRSEHVITIEGEIKFAQESRSSLVSQREVRGDSEEWLAVARGALRENPDVLVLEDLRSPELIQLAIEAAAAGRLVIAAIAARSAAAAVSRLLDQFPPERRSQMQLTLAEVLRGVVAQVLVRKSGGGRVAAREVLLNTPAVASLIAEGKHLQIPLALDSGRKHGMVPLNDALVAFVQSGAVDAREAYRKAIDREAFLNLLKREGIDTSFVERLA